MSLRWRLALWYITLLGLTLAAFSGALYVSLRHGLSTQLDQALQSQAAASLEALEEDGEPPHFENLPPGTVSFWLGPKDQVVASSHPELIGLAGPAPGGMDVLEFHGKRWRRFSTAVMRGGKRWGTLQVLQTLEPIDSSLKQLWLFFCVTIPVTLILAAWGVLFVTGRALQPLREITRAAAEMGAEGLSRRLERPSIQDELGQLVMTFNAMLSRLDEAFLRQKQFTSDAAHELRTPLSLIAARAEVSLTQPRSSQEYQQALREILDESGRLSRLLAKLLSLARAESGSDCLQRETLDLAELALDVIGSLEGVAQTKQVKLLVKGQSGALARGDQTRLVELLLNLVDNAIKYSPWGASVVVGVESTPGAVVLTVSDSGPGIAEENFERVFERFFQVSSARSRDSGESAGLGLSICRAIAQQHGGTLTVESRLGAGATFRLVLPG